MRTGWEFEISIKEEGFDAARFFEELVRKYSVLKKG
jgi:hypothetical protein